MRVTNAVLHREALSNTQRTLREMERYQRAISSGLRVEKPSDDPKALGQIMRSSSGLRALKQYEENLSSAQARLTVEDTTLQQLTDVLTRVKELGIAQAGSTASAETRQVAGAEVEGLRDFVISLGNTMFAGSYIFGGQYADSRPFGPTGADPARPPSGTQQVEGGSGTYYAVNHSGQEIFVDSGVLDALEDMALALTTNSPDDVTAALGDLETAFGEVQELVGDLGARMAQVDTAVSNLDALEVNLKTFRSDLTDTEIEETITKLVNRQVTYEAAMMSNARILQSTLTDYLR